MKRYVYFLLLLTASACQQRTEQVAAGQSGEWQDTDTLLFWNADTDAHTRNRLFKPTDSVRSIQPVLNGINQTWPEPGIFLVKHSLDTITAGFHDPDWLSEKIGNATAEQYFSFAAMNLLEIKGVRVVCFELPEGSHASSSCWFREDFSEWQENK